VRTRLRDRSRAAGKRAHGIAAKLRSRSQLGRDQVKDGVQRITGELADLAQATVRDAHHLLVNARRALRQARVTAAELAEAGVHDAAAGRRRGRLARAVTADRGYGEAAVDDALTDIGVHSVVIPRKGKPGLARQQLERRRTFRRTVKWRTGCEGRISTLKRGYGWDRTRLDSLEGAKTWTGQGIFTHNLTKIAALAA